MDISFEDLTFEILHNGSTLTSFSCENADLYEFLIEDALSSQKKKLSVTRLAIYRDEVVGFFTLVNDCIETKAIAASDSDHGYPYARYPAMKIARLATHDDYRGRDIGTNMLLKVLIIFCRISEYVGCRFMTVDSKPEAAGFYQKFGFKTAQRHYTDTVPMYKNYPFEETGAETRHLSEFRDA